MAWIVLDQCAFSDQPPDFVIRKTGFAKYLADRPEPEFFVTRFIDYAKEDGLFRKYRIVLVDGRLKVPEGPGLGVSVDLAYLEEITTSSQLVRRGEGKAVRSAD